MSTARNRGIAYSLLVLIVMAWAISSTFSSFNIGFIDRSFEVMTRPDAPVHFRVLGLLTVAMFSGVIFLCLRRGIKMWRADEWDSGRRIVRGLELKLDAAVTIGLGLTVFSFMVSGMF